ncbi:MULTISPECIES: MarR family winged helix-turn-helix transcriptional regulator [Polaromonas]|uniref:MarR family winged helix-turn-helix transcriptional regulator n=1 Tax=Polaromonas aquatica TaxID=332657 RepID=A0ABW1TVC0_9BURK
MSTKRKITPEETAATAEENLLMDLFEQPGHLIRRANQIAVSMFFETMNVDVTPIQYSILRMLQESPGIDQVTLAGLVALDKSTAADIAVRLESRGWIHREVIARRQRRLSLTAEGEAALNAMVPAVHTLRDRILASLEPAEKKEFMRLLKKFVHLNNEQSRAPLQRSEARD